jgi:hypothetical protein
MNVSQVIRFETTVIFMHQDFRDGRSPTPDRDGEFPREPRALATPARSPGEGLEAERSLLAHQRHARTHSDGRKKSDADR